MAFYDNRQGFGPSPTSPFGGFGFGPGQSGSGYQSMPGMGGMPGDPGGGGGGGGGGGLSGSDWITIGAAGLGFIGNLLQGWSQGKVSEAQLEVAREQVGISREQFEFMKEQTIRDQQIQQHNTDLIAPAVQDYAGQVAGRATNPIEMPRPTMPNTGNPYQREPDQRRPISAAVPSYPGLGPPPSGGGGAEPGPSRPEPGRPITEPGPREWPHIGLESRSMDPDENREEQVRGMRPRSARDPWDARQLAFSAARSRR